MSSRIWTNDTRRDGGEENGHRAQKRRLPDTQARNPGQQGTSNPGQTRACFTAVQTKDSPACPHVCLYAFSIHIPASRLCSACVHFVVRTFMYVM